MRELTKEEMLLVAGGAMDNSVTPWWESAFDTLSSGLDWIGDVFGGWMDSYLDGWSSVVDHMSSEGDLIYCRDQYGDYVIDSASNGGNPDSFGDWYAGGGCDLPGAP